MEAMDFGDLSSAPVAKNDVMDFGDISKESDPNVRVFGPKPAPIDTRRISYSDKGDQAREWLQKKPEGPSSYSDYLLRVLPESAVRTGINMALVPGQLTGQVLTDPKEAGKGLVDYFKQATGTVAGAVASPYNVSKGDFGQTEGKQGLGKWIAEGQEKILADPFGAAVDPFMAKGMVKQGVQLAKVPYKAANYALDMGLKTVAGEGMAIPEKLAQSALKPRISDTSANVRNRKNVIQSWLSDPNAKLGMNDFVDKNLNEMSDLIGKQNMALDSKGDVRINLDAFDSAVKNLADETPTSLVSGDALKQSVGSVIDNLRKDSDYRAEDNTISARKTNDIKKQVWEDLRGKNSFNNDYHPAMVEAAWKGAGALNKLINEVIPELGETNKRYGDLASLNKQMIRALQRQGNTNVIPLRALIQFAGGDVTGMIKGAAFWIMDEPFFKAAIARKLYKARKTSVLPAELNKVIDGLKQQFAANLEKDAESPIKAINAADRPAPEIPKPGPEAFEPNPQEPSLRSAVERNQTPAPAPDAEYAARDIAPAGPEAEINPLSAAQGETPAPRGAYRPYGEPGPEAVEPNAVSLRDAIPKQGNEAVNPSQFDPSLRDAGGPQPADRVAVDSMIQQMKDKQGGITPQDVGYLQNKLREMGFTDADIKGFIQKAITLGGVAALTTLPFLSDDNKDKGLALGGLMLGSVGMMPKRALEIKEALKTAVGPEKAALYKELNSLKPEAPKAESTKWTGEVDPKGPVLQSMVENIVKNPNFPDIVKQKDLVKTLMDKGATRVEIEALGLDQASGNMSREAILERLQEKGITVETDEYGGKTAAKYVEPNRVDLELIRQHDLDITENPENPMDRGLTDTQTGDIFMEDAEIVDMNFLPPHVMQAARRVLREHQRLVGGPESGKPVRYEGYKPITEIDGVVPGSYTEKFVTIDKDMPEWKDEHTGYNDTDNPIIRVRYDDRVLPDGRKVRRLHEIQDPEDVRKARTPIDERAKKLWEEQAGSARKWEELPEVQQREFIGAQKFRLESPVPHELSKRAFDIGIKQLIAEAKRDGMDGVQWSIGEQQRQIYKGALKNVADEAHWHPESGQLLLFKGGRKSRVQDQVPKSVPKNKLADYLGEDIAKKLTSDEYKTQPSKSLTWEPVTEELGFDAREVANGAETFREDFANGELTYNVIKNDSGDAWHVVDQDGQILSNADFGTKQAAKQWVENKFAENRPHNISDKGHHILKNMEFDAKWPSDVYGDFEKSGKVEHSLEDFGLNESHDRAGKYYEIDKNWSLTDGADFGLGPEDFNSDGRYSLQNGNTGEYYGAHSLKGLREMVKNRTGVELPELPKLVSPKGAYNDKAIVPSLMKKHSKGTVELVSDEPKFKPLDKAEQTAFDRLAEDYDELNQEEMNLFNELSERAQTANSVPKSPQPTMWFDEKTPTSFPIYEGVTSALPLFLKEMKEKGIAQTAIKYGVSAYLLREFLKGDDETRKKMLALPALAGVIKFHGTPEMNVEAIQKSGGIKPYDAPGIKKISGGNMTEEGMVWVTGDEGIAKQYAEGWEHNRHRAFKNQAPVTPGAIFKTDLPDNIKLIDRGHKVTAEQAEKLNKLLPSYKPMYEGDSLSAFEYRSNGRPLKDALQALGYDGMKYGEHQIAVITDHLPAELHKDLRVKVDDVPDHVSTNLATIRKIAPESALKIKAHTVSNTMELVPKGLPIRFTNVGELKGIIETGDWYTGKNAEEQPGISAQILMDHKPTAYGKLTELPAVIVFPKFAETRKGVGPNEVMIDPRTSVESAKFIIDGYKRLFTFTEIQKLHERGLIKEQ